jgi:SAM-dependent methyltransferase
MPVSEPDRGRNTATPRNVTYRVGRIAPYLSGKWLDYGCAEGGYTEELLRRGAQEIVGVDVEKDRVAAATAKNLPGARFEAFDGDSLPLEDDEFDGAFVNEVIEHVRDEQTSLLDIRRVLKPGGRIVVISPNRWFPVEGHMVNIGRRSFGPAPLIPWLPERLTRRWTEARNYWPRQLIGHVRDAGFAIAETGFIWPVFEQYPWLPTRMAEAYVSRMERLDDLPGIRRFGLSTLIVGVKPLEASAQE